MSYYNKDKVGQAYKVYCRFYADNEPHYKNKKFSFEVGGADRDECLKNAHKLIYRFIDHNNKIRAAWLVVNGHADRLFDQLNVINGKQVYSFHPKH